jgi:hypothetical protein
MFVETLLTRAELEALLSEALPLRVNLGDGDAHWLALTSLSDVSLVPELGLRAECKARLHWPLLGVDAPVFLHSLRAVMTPEIVGGKSGDALAFRLAIEHADFAAIPDRLDRKLTDAINAKLAEKSDWLVWDLSRTLRLHVPLPPALEPRETLETRAAWGKIRVTREALILAVSIHGAIVRQGGIVPEEYTPLPRAHDGDRPSRSSRARDPLAAAARVIGLVGALGLAAIAIAALVRAAA